MVSKKAEERYRAFLDLPRLVKDHSVRPNWMADGSSFWFAHGAPDNTVIWKVDPLKKTKEPLIDVARARKALAKILEHEPPYTGLPFDTVTLRNNERAAQFVVEDRDFVLDLDTYEVEAVVDPGRSLAAAPTPGGPPNKADRERFVPRKVRDAEMAGAPDVMEVLSPDKKWFAGVADDQLYVRSTYDGKIHTLTSDGVKDHTYEVRGASWSPDSLHVVVAKIDVRDVHKVPLVKWLKPLEQIEWRTMAKTGGRFPQWEFHIVDINSGRTTRIDIGDEPDRYGSVLGWRPDGKEFFVSTTDRCNTRTTIFAVDPSSGSTTEILTETSETFLAGISVPLPPFTALYESDRFIWRAERTNWAHLYLYDFDGKLRKQLTTGNWPVIGVVGVNEKDGIVYFLAQHDTKRPYDVHLCRVKLDGTGLKRLTKAPGVHDVFPSPSKKVFVDVHSSLDRPPTTEVLAADGKVLMTLVEADISKLTKLGWTPPEEFWVKADDGKTDLRGVLYKPVDFDPKKKYPVIDAIYGGPQTILAPRRFLEPSPLAVALAQLGFIVFNVDARGTPGRGKAFQDVVFKRFGQHEIPDHVAALEQLAKDRPYMDLDRVGIYGGSWGGYMTVRGMLTAPETYHVAVATNGVYNHIDHMAQAIEPYMRLPSENPEGYAASDSLQHAHRLAGKLLLIHATDDMNATFSATMKLVEALTRAGKHYDLIVLPEQNHHPSGNGMLYYLDAHRRYFVEHLKP